MKKFLAAACAILLVTPAVARSDAYFYGSASGLFGHQRFTHIDVNIYDPSAGVWMHQPTADLSDNVWGGAVAAGYGLDDFRVELELALREKAQVNNATIKSDSLIFAFYYDFNKYRVTPFLGIGGGASRVGLHIENLDLSNARINFTGMGAAGLRFRVTDAVSLNLSYRYFYLGHVGLRKAVDLGGSLPAILDVTARADSSEVTLGATYRF